VALVALPYFPTFSRERHDWVEAAFSKNKLYVVILCVDFMRNICHSKKKKNSCEILLKNASKFSYKLPVIIVRISSKLCFLGGFSKKNTQISNFVKIHPGGENLFHACRQT